MYCAEINWYNAAEGMDVIECVLVAAADWNDAMDIINGLFSNINSIQIHEITNSSYKKIDRALYQMLY